MKTKRLHKEKRLPAPIRASGRRWGLSAIIFMLSAVSAVGLLAPTISADSVGELRQRSEQLQAEIRANNEKVSELEHHAETLEEHLAQLRGEIAHANQEIATTDKHIAELEQKLQETEAELERQKELLKANMRALYKRGGASTVELLVASDSFSQFIDDQEYLERLKVSIQESVKKVVELKHLVQTQKTEQEELKKNQEHQRNLIAAKQREQRQLLEQTRGEETRYRDLVAQQREALAEAEAELSRLITGGNFVSQGPVGAGDTVGYMGSTGFSTGPHLHYMVINNGSTVNPRAGGNTLVYGLGWPVPARGWGNVSQEYGCVAPYGWYKQKCGGNQSFHTGLDIAGWYGDRVVASRDGEIVFRGCQGGLGFVVVVNHGSGLFTYYPHLTTPSGQSSGYCG